MMSELIKTLPFIIGAAISPVLLVTTLLILSQEDRPVTKTLAFLLGGMTTIAAISVVVFYTTFLRSLPTGNRDTLAHIVIGLVLILLAIDIYRRGPAKPSDKAKPKKKQGLVRYLLLGVLLMLSNFTTIAMVFAVAVELRISNVSSLAKLGYLIATVVSSLLPILIPLFIIAAAGKHSASILGSLSAFMKRYAHVVTAIFFGLLGIYSLAKPFLG